MSANVIREARPDEEGAIRSLVFSILDEYDIEPAPKTIDADMFDLERFYEGGRFLVMEDSQGRLVGSVGLRRIDQSRAELRKLYVVSALRGKGHGARLLKAALAEARALGFAEVYSLAGRRMEEAIGIFRKYGFAPCDDDVLRARDGEVLKAELGEARR